MASRKRRHDEVDHDDAADGDDEDGDGGGGESEVESLETAIHRGTIGEPPAKKQRTSGGGVETKEDLASSSSSSSSSDAEKPWYMWLHDIREADTEQRDKRKSRRKKRPSRGAGAGSAARGEEDEEAGEVDDRPPGGNLIELPKTVVDKARSEFKAGLERHLTKWLAETARLPKKITASINKFNQCGIRDARRHLFRVIVKFRVPAECAAAFAARKADLRTELCYLMCLLQESHRFNEYTDGHTFKFLMRGQVEPAEPLRRKQHAEPSFDVYSTTRYGGGRRARFSIFRKEYEENTFAFTLQTAKFMLASPMDAMTKAMPDDDKVTNYVMRDLPYRPEFESGEGGDGGYQDAYRHVQYAATWFKSEMPRLVRDALEPELELKAGDAADADAAGEDAVQYVSITAKRFDSGDGHSSGNLRSEPRPQYRMHVVVRLRPRAVTAAKTNLTRDKLNALRAKIVEKQLFCKRQRLVEPYYSGSGPQPSAYLETETYPLLAFAVFIVAPIVKTVNEERELFWSVSSAHSDSDLFYDLWEYRHIPDLMHSHEAGAYHPRRVWFS